jgi:hypothetical protein
MIDDLEILGHEMVTNLPIVGTPTLPNIQQISHQIKVLLLKGS